MNTAMKIYEHDYTKVPSNTLPLGEFDENSPIKPATDLPSALPYALMHDQKQFYKECLRRMELFGMRYRGTVRTDYDPDNHVATIKIALPSYSFKGIEDMDVLSFIASKAKQATVTCENEKIVILVLFDCFSPIFE